MFIMISFYSRRNINILTNYLHKLRICQVFYKSTKSTKSTASPLSSEPIVDTSLEYEPGVGSLENDFMIPTKKQLRGLGPSLKEEFKIWKKEMKEYYKGDPAYIVNQGEINKVFSFSTKEDIEGWGLASDSMEGTGYSTCTLTQSDNGHALFSGNLSTEVPLDGKTFRAGFCAIRAPRPMRSFYRKSTYDWTGYTHLVFKVRGDGRSYLINLGTEGYYDVNWFNMYTYGLFTRGGPYWQISKIPFSKFIFSNRGHIQDEQDPIALDEITTFGLAACDDIDGPFQLEIEYIGIEFDLKHKEEHAYEGYDVNKFMLTND